MLDSLNGLPLPHAWRLIFQNHRSLGTQDPPYADLALLADGGPKALPASQFGRWDVDQDEGSFTATLNDGRSLTANVHFIGTHDGRDFLWADRNPSLHDSLCGAASALRKHLPAELSPLSKTDTIKISPRDTHVLTGLAAQVFDCDLVVMAPSDEPFIAMALTNAQVSTAENTRKKGVISRFFGKTPKPSVAEQRAALRQTVNAALNQWQQHRLPATELRALEPDFARADAAIRTGESETALNILAELQSRMGPHPQDQEPTGWVYFCEGLTAAATGDLARARTAYAIASRAIDPVPAIPLLVAQARAAKTDTRNMHLNAAYIRDPAEFAQLANADEISVVKAALLSASASRNAASPTDVLHAIITALCDIEKTAAARNNAARKTRDQAHIESDADKLATLATNRDYADLLLAWATPHREAALGGYSSAPTHDPDLIASVQTVLQTDSEATFIVTFDGRVPDTTSPCRYTLRRATMPLLDTPQWRLDEIVGGLDNGEYRIF